MLQQQIPTPQPAARPTARIGVGIDTSRYGHYAAFLGDDRQPAADELAFAESAAGSARLRQRREALARRHGPVTCVTRRDAAGPYADNRRHFLQQLGPSPACPTGAIPGADFTLSWGDPQRNQNYRAARFGAKKPDPVAARAAAHFAGSQRPAPTPPASAQLRTRRQVAARLPATVRQRTRLVNPLHHLRALSFPELARLVQDLSQGRVLELVHRYPTAARLAAATAADLAAIPYLPDRHVTALLEQARAAIASRAGPAAEELVRDQVRQVRDANARQKRLEILLVEAYRALPRSNHLDTIPGIGAVTAAVRTACIIDSDRFDAPGKLVAYFGVLPIEVSSGVDRDGQPRGSRRYVRSRRGNGRVRRYLWMAALAAVRCNPAVRALYRRLVAKHPGRKAIAIGHALRKLLHLAFALWKRDRPFDPQHYPWEGPAAQADEAAEAPEQPPAAGAAATNQAAGHQPESKPAAPVVTAACAPTVAPQGRVDEGTFIDFAHRKGQLPLGRVLEHPGRASRLRGSGPPRRGACPLHRGDGRGRTFRVNREANVFHGFATGCGKEGDVIDLGAELHQQSLRAAALDLVQTVNLEPAPARATEKRNG